MRERNGVCPASIPDWLALVGDTADGIPGLAGFGAKSAAALLNVYGTIEAIPEDFNDWQVKVRGAARLGATLAGHREDALLYKQLATLRTDVPLTQTLDDLEWRGADRKAFEVFAERMGGLNARPTFWR